MHFFPSTEPLELGGSLLCSYHKNDDIHSDKPRYIDRDYIVCTVCLASENGVLLLGRALRILKKPKVQHTTSLESIANLQSLHRFR